MATKAKKRTPRSSGKLTGKMLEDLCRRLQDQVNIAEALEAAARPHDDVTVSEYPMLKVLELCSRALCIDASQESPIHSRGRGWFHLRKNLSSLSRSSERSVASRSLQNARATVMIHRFRWGEG
jgi:hypothetical protein